jgi:hypothetical protein
MQTRTQNDVLKVRRVWCGLAKHIRACIEVKDNKDNKPNFHEFVRFYCAEAPDCFSLMHQRFLCVLMNNSP